MTDSGAGGPIWEEFATVASHPIRQVFMAGLVWRVAEEAGDRPLRILEVGSWCGLSTLTWAHALARFNGAGGEITCIDAWAPYLDTGLNHTRVDRLLDEAARTGKAYETFVHNVSFAPTGIDIVSHRARGDEALPAFDPGAYDIVYLDGDHSHAAVAKDIELSRPLVRDGGVLCGDDLEIQAHEIEAVSERPEGLPDYVVEPATGRTFHPGVTRAVGEAFGPVSAWMGFWALRGHAGSWRRVSLEGMPFFVPPHLPKSHLTYIKKILMSRAETD